MSVGIAAARRPLAMFEYSNDGTKTIAKIMQHGDKFSIPEKDAEEWLAHIEQESLQGRYDPTWVAQFKLEYQAFLKGNELPRDGTPIRTWGMIAREPANRLVQMNVLTVEDLAAHPDSGLAQLGLDGRYLRDLAKNFLENGEGQAAMAKKLADLEQLVRTQSESIDRLEKQNEALAAKRKAA